MQTTLQSVEQISVFDMLKIGVGPSSSHTLGPWRAAERFLQELSTIAPLEQVVQLNVSLYGSLALTGKGHGTDIAILLGLSGEDPETISPEQVQQIPQSIQDQCRLQLQGKLPIHFDPITDIQFFFAERLPFHANGMSLKSFDHDGMLIYEATYYSVGGGFVVKENESESNRFVSLPFPAQNAAELLTHCRQENQSISEIVWKNEKVWRSETEIHTDLWRIWEVMKICVYQGCHTTGILPGGLSVKRRAAEINHRLLQDGRYDNTDEWIQNIRALNCDFSRIVKWLGCFAMAVNEENANFGRVVTAPTNGASGVIPAVLYYLLCFYQEELDEKQVIQFLLVAGEIGSLFKKGATISAAMGGCQAEIGVSSAMAAAALTECMGGNPEQVLMAAEIAMEHHLGLTCDPIGGLVQIPCIERNSMGAVKAITAAHIALESDPSSAKISLDDVISTMWETAQDMHHKYKETSQGGLAARIRVSVPEC